MERAAQAFGIPVSLPPGWTDETVHVFAAPERPAVPGRPAAQRAPRATISAMRARARTLEDAVARLGEFGAPDATVLLDELREDGGLRFYERVARFADPVTGAPVQQAARVYHHEDQALIVLLSAPAIDFKGAYDGYAAVAHTIAEGAR